MKNTNITSLKKPVPVNIRIEIYEEAISIIKEGRPKYSMSDFHLCILFPCILWDLESFYNPGPSNGEDWEYEDTTIAFPELTEKIISQINSCSNKNDLRIMLLENFIKILKNGTAENKSKVQ
jgi:hypothetical protein